MRFLLYAGLLIIATGMTVSLYPVGSVSAVEECLSGIPEYKLSCLQELIVAHAEGGQLREAFEILAAGYHRDADFADSCHGNAHELGKAAYQAFHRGLPLELSAYVGYCGFGFFHGFMEELLGVTQDFGEARTFCESLKGQWGGPRGESACYHGFGHGAFDGSDPRAYGNVMALSAPGLTICAAVSEKEFHKKLCASGVFNSLAIALTNKRFGLEPNIEAPYDVRGLFLEDYERLSCYDQMNTLVMDLARNNLSKALMYATKIPELQVAQAAVEGIVTYYASFHKQDTEAVFGSVVSACRELPATLTRSCLRGFGAGLVEFGMPGKEHMHALAFCQQDVLTGDEQRDCLYRTIPLLRGLSRDAKEFSVLCRASVDARFVDVCTPRI